MASYNIAYNNAISSPRNGQNALLGVGENYQFNLTMPQASGGTATIILTDVLTGIQTQIGAGYVTGINFIFVQTFNNKVLGLAGGTVYASAIGDPPTWNNLTATGNGFITLSNWFATTLSLVGFAPYQGRLAFFARRNVQIWVIDPNLNNWAIVQTLTNIGALNGLTIQPIGDLDVMFLSDTGIRSLRVHDSSLNAYVVDIGSPVDSLIQTALLAGNSSGACAIVEPTANRYWCFLNGVIYTFSYFPSNEITAWGSYLPTAGTTIAASAGSYSGGGTVTYPVTSGRDYYWTKGAHDTSITDGVNTYPSVPGITAEAFTAQSNTLTMTGLASQTVTATLVEQTPFTPSKFVSYNGQVYARDASNFYLYGGTNNNTYDGCICTGSTSWLDFKAPSMLKTANSIDSAFIGAWKIQASMDQLDEPSFVQVVQANRPTFQLGNWAFSSQGYHARFNFITYGNTAASLSSLIFNFTPGNEK